MTFYSNSGLEKYSKFLKQTLKTLSYEGQD